VASRVAYTTTAVLRIAPSRIYGCDVSGRYIADDTGGGRCSNWPSSACSRRPRCTATSSARKLVTKLGTIRAAISYGTLYPTLKRLQTVGWITESASDPSMIPPMTSKRGRVVYKITAEGKERFADLLAQAGPETYDDAGFGVHFAFFSRTDRAPAAHPRGRRRGSRSAARACARCSPGR
jgi:DNA-binding PadR family transcriptional regulator